MTKKVAVILSGCGVRDGSEIHEATCSLLAIRFLNANYQCFSINKEQYQVINHLTNQKTSEKRNVLAESARIARGNIKSLDEFNATEYGLLVFPGGSGAAMNLCSYAYEGKNYTVDKAVSKAILNMIELQKPICAFCIAPVIIAKVLKDSELTVGGQNAVSSDIEKAGAKHVETKKGEYHVDEKNKIISSACYMNNITIDELYQEISKGIKKGLEM
ncbi:isoprenoid biosynthesis glyoxalase ElbB [Pseudomonadota bacterium]